MDGILLVDKPADWTSHDAVAKVRALLRQAQSQKQKAKSQNKTLSTNSFKLSARAPKVRVGHTGTLDPMATGLLVLVLGSYTKRAGEFSKLDKTYKADLTLGATSSTGDAEGEIKKRAEGRGQRAEKKPRREEVEQVLHAFLGEIEQTPPAFSAIKVDGKRAYKLARAGQKVQMEPRKVKIYSIKSVQYKYPKLTFTTEVSSGTYIRSLAVDIGEALNTGAYLSRLRRTQVGSFDITDAAKLEELNAATLQNKLLNHA